jgi:hypothetical protein
VSTPSTSMAMALIFFKSFGATLGTNWLPRAAAF